MAKLGLCLEAMEERQVSIDGETRPLPSPFFVIATQNPLFHSGTSALPESQLDRFLMRLSLGFPDRAAEQQLLLTDTDERVHQQIQTILSPEELHKLQSQVHHVQVSEPLVGYLLDLVSASRHRTDMLPISPRGAKALLRAAKAYAFLHHRTYVTADDVQAVFPAVTEHRLQLRQQQHHASLSTKLLQEVPCRI